LGMPVRDEPSPFAWHRRNLAVAIHVVAAADAIGQYEQLSRRGRVRATRKVERQSAGVSGPTVQVVSTDLDVLRVQTDIRGRVARTFRRPSRVGHGVDVSSLVTIR